MEVMMQQGGGDLCRCCSSTTMDYDIACAWSSWVEPLPDWLAPYSATVADDFHDLLDDSMMCADDDPAAISPNSNTSTGTLAEDELTTFVPDCGNEKGLRLVHLLAAAAEALAGPGRSPELARVILVRLKELVLRAGGDGGTSMERLAAHFVDALQGLLDTGGSRSSFRDGHPSHSKADVLTAFQLLQDMSPYIKFGHFTANQAILEATLGDRRVHVVDFDIGDGVQWASLMQALVSQPAQPPHLRITTLSRAGSSRAAQETGRRLAAFAASIGQPFSFAQSRLDPDERFRPASVKVVKGEKVVMNCVLHPTTAATGRGSVASFLSGAAALGAKVVTLVEEEDDEGEEATAAGAEEDELERGSSFVGRFMAELRRHSAVWESLEAGFPIQGMARGMVERVILGPRIAGAVSRAYREAVEEGGERDYGSWVVRMAAMGFERVGISCFNHCQAKLLLGLFNNGYKVEEDAINKLVLGWKARRLLSASVWRPPPHLPVPPPPEAPHLMVQSPSSQPLIAAAVIGGSSSCVISNASLEDSDFFCD